MRRDFEKANRRDLTKRVYDPIASFRPHPKSIRSRQQRARAFYARRARINEQLQRAYWPQKFGISEPTQGAMKSSVAGEKTGQPDLTGNTNPPCGEAGTYPEGMGNPSPRKNT